MAKKWTIKRLRDKLEDKGIQLAVGGDYALDSHRAFTSLRDGIPVQTAKTLLEIAEYHEVSLNEEPEAS